MRARHQHPRASRRLRSKRRATQPSNPRDNQRSRTLCRRCPARRRRMTIGSRTECARPSTTRRSKSITKRKRPRSTKRRRETEDVRTGGNRTVGDTTETGVDVGTGSERADSWPPTDAYDDVSEPTDIGGTPQPPPAPVRTHAQDARAGERADAGRADSIVPAAAVPDEESTGNAPFDANATIEQNPQTPVPTLTRGASMMSNETPVPTLDRAASVVSETPAPSRAQSVPMSTAPSSLPPPKETSSARAARRRRARNASRRWPGSTSICGSTAAAAACTSSARGCLETRSALRLDRDQNGRYDGRCRGCEILRGIDELLEIWIGIRDDINEHAIVLEAEEDMRVRVLRHL